MGKKIRYKVKYRSDSAPKGSYVEKTIEAESESEVIDKVRKQHPKATNIVATPK